MKVYDIALAFIRALAVFDLIREAGSLIFAILRLMVPAHGAGAASIRGFELGTLFLSAFSILVLLIILALSRPIARFAAKLAAPADAAGQF